MLYYSDIRVLVVSNCLIYNSLMCLLRGFLMKKKSFFCIKIVNLEFLYIFALSTQSTIENSSEHCIVFVSFDEIRLMINRANLVFYSNLLMNSVC